MKSPNRLIFNLILIFILIFAGRILSKVPNAPDNLRCFDKINPVGTEGVPYFGWYVNDPDDNEIQTAYQILVASSEEKLAADEGDLWNSGRVKSGRQNYVDYSGKPLAAATRYFWKVRTWDKDGNISPYSAAATFDVGLLISSDWAGAKWIKRDTNDEDDYTFYRKNVKFLNKTMKRAIVYVTAMHKYELYLNGKLVGKGPAYHYPQYHYYNAFDITKELLANTENGFACQTHWFGGGQGRPKGSRGFLLKAVVEYTDSSVEIIGTDSTWKCLQVEAWLTGQRRRNGEGIGYIEKIDAGRLLPDWNMLAFDDSAWPTATEIGAPPVEPWTEPLQADLTRLVEKEITPVSVTDLGEGKYVIDLGKVYPGVPVITFSGGTAGTVLDMRGGYVLNEDGTVAAGQSTQSTNMSYYFISDGGTTVFKPMEYLGMRYFQVDNSPNVLNKENVKFICRHYELNPARSEFSSSNQMLNQVWDLMKHSLIAGTMEQFVDTPTREKGSFLGDSWLQGVPAMTVFGDRVMNLRVLLEFLDSQDQYWPDGRLNAVYPNGDGKRDIPDYTQMYLVWAWDYYLQTGNVRFLSENYDKLKKVAEYVDTYKNEETGLIHKLAGGRGPYEFGIIDWPAQMRYGYDVAVESRTVVDAYAYADFDAIAKIAALLGKKDDAALYEKKAGAMKAAINEKLINSQGVYVDGLYADKSPSEHVSQHANMFPLAMGIVPEANLKPVVAAIKERKMSVGMVTLRWLPEAIGKAEEGAHLLELYTNPEWDGWAQTISLGGTATWEAWDANTNGQSMSHPWGAVGLLGIQQFILGVQPLKPQHAEILVKPLDFGDKLKHAKGTLPTDRGDISVEWERAESVYRLKLNLPDNMSAKVCLPKCRTKSRKVKVDGKNVKASEDSDFVFVENVGSGEHVFEQVLK